MKKLATIVVLVVVLIAGCSASTSAEADVQVERVVQVSSLDDSVQGLVERVEKPFLMGVAVGELKARVGKTWYVFSGSTPGGWDCSGLVKWFYSRLGVDLVHRASVQKHSGVLVSEPAVGDIVAFGWKGYDGAGHVGVYVGGGLMVHAPGPGKATRVDSVSAFAKGNWNSLVTYTRVEWYNN